MTRTATSPLRSARQKSVPFTTRTWGFLLFATLISCAAPLKDIPYTKPSDPLQSLDLYFPRNPENAPVFVIIHGGGWAMGDKSNRGFVQPKTRWLQRHGYLVASINYRLSPDAQHPDHIDDVCRSIAWIQQNIATHGGDPTRIHLLGHSAGAHLAALAGVDHQRLKAAGADPAAIRSVTLIDGAGYDIPLHLKEITHKEILQDMFLSAFTKDLKTQKDASPIHRVRQTPPPFLILHLADRPDSIKQSNLLADALSKAGGKTTVVPIADKTHNTINRDLGNPADPTTIVFGNFLDDVTSQDRLGTQTTESRPEENSGTPADS